MGKFLSKGDIYGLMQYFEGSTASTLFGTEAPDVIYTIGFRLVIRDPRNYMVMAGYDTAEGRRILTELEAERNGGKLWLRPSLFSSDLDVPVGMVSEYEHRPQIDVSMRVECDNGERMEITIAKRLNTNIYLQVNSVRNAHDRGSDFGIHA